MQDTVAQQNKKEDVTRFTDTSLPCPAQHRFTQQRRPKSEGKGGGGGGPFPEDEDLMHIAKFSSSSCVSAAHSLARIQRGWGDASISALS